VRFVRNAATGAKLAQTRATTDYILKLVVATQLATFTVVFELAGTTCTGFVVAVENQRLVIALAARLICGN
jgi:hypothetical protein